MRIQQCRYCGDFYRMDDEAMETLETDAGWGIEICRQCSDEINREEQDPLDAAWDWWYAQQLCDENNDEGETQ